jgi:hypothetical protein
MYGIQGSLGPTSHHLVLPFAVGHTHLPCYRLHHLSDSDLYHNCTLIVQGLSLLGAIYALSDPVKYASDLLPENTERLTAVLGKTVRGQMLIGALGSCESTDPGYRQRDPHRNGGRTP